VLAVAMTVAAEQFATWIAAMPMPPAAVDHTQSPAFMRPRCSNA